MKLRIPYLMIAKPPAERSGVSLTEVLVSVIIMSIGVVLLSTLLPISILRTAQATQLTQAVFLRNNAEAAVESNLGILSNTQISFPAGATNSTSVFAVVDPLGTFLVNPAQPQFGGPAVLPSPILRISGGATSLVAAESLAQLPDSFSLVAEGAVTQGAALTTGLTATPPYITFARTSVSGLNVRNTGNSQAAIHRLVMFDITGKFGVVLPLSNVLGGTQLSWWDPSNTGANPGPSIPSGFVPATARVESLERRFTWLMTVRKRLASTASNFGTPIDGSWIAEINVAVFFNRSFNANDELPFSVSQTGVGGSLFGFDLGRGVAGVDDDGNGTPDDVGEVGWLGSDDNRTVTVSFAPGSPPPLKKGGYMLEPSQLKWYRIINFTPVTATSNSSTLLLDQDIRVPNGSTIAQGIFMKGIVEVYALGSRTGQQ